MTAETLSLFDPPAQPEPGEAREVRPGWMRCERPECVNGALLWSAAEGIRICPPCAEVTP